MASKQNPAALCGAPVLTDLAGASINPDNNHSTRALQVTVEPITISLQGPPQGKGRARAFQRGGRIGHYTPEKTRTYEGMIRTVAMQELGSRPPLDEPIEFMLRAVFPVPASWSERKRQQAIAGDIKPGKKPDLDNICKAWNDALNGLVYRDDSLICRMILDKRYGPQALVVVTVKAVSP